MRERAHVGGKPETGQPVRGRPAQLAARLLQRTFVRFCLIGGVATLIHAGVFFLLLRAGGSQLLANCGGYAIASIWSYALNAGWTFSARRSWRGFIRFQMANTIVLIWSVVAALIGEALAFPPFWTLALTVLVGPVLNYLGHRHFTFRKA